MRSTKATRWLSGTLAALLLAQGMCLPAGAWSWGGWGNWGSSSQTSQVETQEAKAEVQLQNGTAIIPSNANNEQVKEILFNALVEDSNGKTAQELDWEYYCEGKNWTNAKKWNWGSIFGFETGYTSIDKYKYSALAEQSDSTSYQIRLVGTNNAVTVTKTSGVASTIKVKNQQTVNLTYDAAGNIDYSALRTAIFNAVVDAESCIPVLTVNDVVIQQQYKNTFGQDKWGNLEGDDATIGGYDAVGEGTYTLLISYAGGNVDGTNYLPVSAQVQVTFNAGRETPVITLKDNCTVSLHDGDWDAVRQEILENVVAENNYGLTTDNTTIEYYAEAESGSAGDLGKDWAALEGETKEYVGFVPITYPAVSDGTHKIRVTFHGSDAYEGADPVEVEVRFVSKQDSTINLNDGDYSANLSYNEDLSVNYDALREEIYKAVVASTDPENLAWNSDNMTITYLATYKLIDTNSDTATNDILTKWVPLEGEEERLGYYPAISEGPQQIKISWVGNDDYYGFETEVTVNITGREQAPYELKNPIGAVTLDVDESLNVNYAELYKAIFDAVVADSEVLTANNVTITYEAKLVTSLDAKYVPLEGDGIYPAISAGSQKIHIFWPGNQTYAPTTIEATVQVNDREQVQFNLNEAPYEVGMIFNAEQGYDYAATAKAIYDTVVSSTTPAVDFSKVTLEFSKTGANFEPLDQTNFFASFGVGDWKIKISVADAQAYRGNSVIVNVTTTDNRLASAVALKSGASFTYNMDANAMKQAIFDNVIDWDNSTLPAKETLSLDDFVIEYKAKLTDAESGVDLGLEDLEDLFGKIPGMDDFLNNDILTQWVPLEGKVYSIGDTVLGKFPQIGAGENQSIRISYKGNAEYRPSETAEGTVTVNKAKVSVKVNSTNIYADEQVPANFITTDPADEFDIYTIYAGVTSSVSTGVYLDLPDRYTAEGSLLLQLIDKALETAGQKTLTQMLNDGVTVGELRELFSTQELLDLLDKLNIDTGTFGQILSVINKLPGVMDSVRIGFGTPNRAGLYTVTAITDNKNYETGVGFGFLLTKMRFSGPKLTWNDEILNGKLTAAEAQNFDFDATLYYDGLPVKDQSSVHYLYSGFTSSWRVYSSTTTAPTEPGRYVVTVCILGGNYMAAPITRSFQITK